MNDGALIHQLATNDYLDYRPQLNAAWMCFTKERLYKNGTYDENILWLFGSAAFDNKVSMLDRKSVEFSNGGYYTFRNKSSFGMTRCTTYKHRPAQADMLHFDLWINDINILADSGTYSYNTNPEYLSYLWEQLLTTQL
ncbi:hypothetical protein CV093_17895 [Oceanobacillus sp. 143]|nr:hypothetical protein CV093_17895 [Oceanobacillus sp. 143]